MTRKMRLKTLWLTLCLQYLSGILQPIASMTATQRAQTCLRGPVQGQESPLIHPIPRLFQCPEGIWPPMNRIHFTVNLYFPPKCGSYFSEPCLSDRRPSPKALKLLNFSDGYESWGLPKRCCRLSKGFSAWRTNSMSCYQNMRKEAGAETEQDLKNVYTIDLRPTIPSRITLELGLTLLERDVTQKIRLHNKNIGFITSISSDLIYKDIGDPHNSHPCLCIASPCTSGRTLFEARVHLSCAKRF
jgi:hypothetical protein